ncbi:MAG TPA: DNA polymerase/3'-5' exonuclease PolX [Candidatus Sumerlaeota bacterium]|nr:MAG: DNA polymerase/3'-5' exonuclease PolX [candidate division BRC1 bacterium ADurb.Bin183]HOE63255.1 DNA polymerase/3'-5' exonuclease PolX [Candidatus Sumerlaeota bacterium]HRR29842.1 DNA polymerase/3'-5' exonuclease PolX [Candidatus Sumerlaeia bacterium]HON50613.1 DNA polymerase/3'-5' exonuclease PolX [Candidatus Sumerlaeota bacterium]HOR65435.1 DNA polymerase/3'-5' exonuclease PolX [Candidatus Sumerlaeota bacterium]
MDKKELAEVLEDIATLLEIKGENPFKSNAYRNAARTIETLEKPLEDFQVVEDFRGLKGIGVSIAEKILTLLKEGRLPYYEQLKASIPSGLIDMLSIPGFGPKKVRAVYENLGVSTVGELEYACHENKLVELAGFGAKTQENILKGIEYLKKSQGRFYFHEALDPARELCAAMQKVGGLKKIEIAGSLRRFNDTVKDIDILASAENPHAVMDAFVSHLLVESVINRGDTKCSVRLINGINADLRVVSEPQFPYALMYFTGSKAHNVALRGRALKMGYKLNEYGLFPRDSETSEFLGSEKEVFKKLGLAFIPPELREDRGELEAAESGSIPRLVEMSDIKGIFHVHTPYSDGLASIREYADECLKRGFEYLGVSDHSRSATYANGLSPERIQKQGEEIDALNKKIKNFRIFKGIESDILSDGSLDYPDEVLKNLDFVIASIHSGFKKSKEEMTRRLIKAIENPYTTMLGHPTGRLLLAREGYEVDMEEVIRAAAQNGKIIELNANPYRFDIDWRLIRKAVDSGVLISINPDAHRLDNLDYTFLGAGMARKGWSEARHIFNTRSAKEVEEYFKKRSG